MKNDQKLVSIEFTGIGARGYYPYKDSQGRITAIVYMLDDTDAGELKLEVVRP